VATTVSIGVVGMLHRAVWVPSLLGIAGTVVLFYGSMLLIAETRVALRSVNEEMAFVLSLPQRYGERQEVGEIRTIRDRKTEIYPAFNRSGIVLLPEFLMLSRAMAL